QIVPTRDPILEEEDIQPEEEEEEDLLPPRPNQQQQQQQQPPAVVIVSISETVPLTPPAAAPSQEMVLWSRIHESTEASFAELKQRIAANDELVRRPRALPVPANQHFILPMRDSLSDARPLVPHGNALL